MQLDPLSLRKEIKYKVFYKDIGRLYSWLGSKSFFKKTYKERQVNSLYFDTENNDFAFSNVTGESKRIKLRARWYSETGTNFIKNFNMSSQLFTFEAKRKSNNFSDKIVLGKIKTNQVSTTKGRLNLLMANIRKNLEHIPSLLNQELIHSVFVSYNREYYEYRTDSDIRLTVDKNFCYSTVDAYSKMSLKSKNFYIVELKFNPKKKFLAEKIMHEFPFRQVRSSKYIYALSNLKQVAY